MFVIAGYSMMVLVATALVSQLTVSGALAPPSVMSGPGADIAQCAQAGVCSSDPGLMVTTSGQRYLQSGVRRKIYVRPLVLFPSS